MNIDILIKKRHNILVHSHMEGRNVLKSFGKSLE